MINSASSHEVCSSGTECLNKVGVFSCTIKFSVSINETWSAQFSTIVAISLSFLSKIVIIRTYPSLWLLKTSFIPRVTYTTRTSRITNICCPIPALCEAMLSPTKAEIICCGAAWLGWYPWHQHAYHKRSWFMFSPSFLPHLSSQY